MIYGQCAEDTDEAPFVCDVCEDHLNASLGGLTAQQHANARLIAAAPKLLDEANNLLFAIQSIMQTGSDVIHADEIEEEMQRLSAALAQATGPDETAEAVSKEAYPRQETTKPKESTMNTFRIGIWEEIGGYVTINAETEEEAEAIAQATLDEDGAPGFPDLDITHRGCEIVDCQEA
jgi:hypothetical protein